jgi:hypothetical protein
MQFGLGVVRFKIREGFRNWGIIAALMASAFMPLTLNLEPGTLNPEP